MNGQERSTGGRRFLRTLLVVVVVLGVAALAIWGFFESRGEAAREAAREQPVSAPRRVTIENGEPVITLDAEAQRQSGIEMVTLQSAPYREQHRAYGTVLDLQPLTEIRNSSVSATAQVQTAQAKLVASKTAFERAQKLYKDQQNMSAAQLQAAEASFHIDQAGLAAAGSQLRASSETAQQAWGPVLAQAIVDGAPMLTRLMARQDVLLLVTLPPGVSVVEAPTDAFVQADNGARTKIQLVSPATKTDPHIQGSSFFYIAPADGALLPGMNVLAFLASDKTVEGAIVPASAIVWWQGNAWAYLRTRPETFARREISTEVPSADGGYVVSGLPDKAEVVAQGAQMLLSEEFRSQPRAGGED